MSEIIPNEDEYFNISHDVQIYWSSSNLFWKMFFFFESIIIDNRKQTKLVLLLLMNRKKPILLESLPWTQSWKSGVEWFNKIRKFKKWPELEGALKPSPTKDRIFLQPLFFSSKIIDFSQLLWGFSSEIFCDDRKSRRGK